MTAIPATTIATASTAANEITSAISDSGGKWIRTHDGRIVEYSVHGSQRNDAYVFVTAFLSEHWSWPEPWCEAYETLNIKSISISLPGLGKSSRHPGQKIFEWPQTDLLPILDAEHVDAFVVWGVSIGCLYAMAAVHYFGPSQRVQALGLRAPYLPRSICIAKKLPTGPIEFPTTYDLYKDTFHATVYRYWFRVLETILLMEPGGWMEYWMEHGWLGSVCQSMIAFSNKYPKEMHSLRTKVLQGAMPINGLLYLLAPDVAFILNDDDDDDDDARNRPYLKDEKKRETKEDCDRAYAFPHEWSEDIPVVVWYTAAADDDAYCPLLHGKWLSDDYFQCRWSRVLHGYGHFGAAYIDMNIFFHRLLDGIVPPFQDG